MNIIGGAARVITRTADATTAAAGAVGGAAVNGVIGGVQGTVSGIRNGLSSGSHSTPAAALTLGVIGAAGLVDWPLLLGIGGTALAVHHLGRRSDGQPSHGQPAVTAVTPLQAAGARGAPANLPRASRRRRRRGPARQAQLAAAPPRQPVTAGCRIVMELTRLLRKSAALPLRAAEAAANTTVGVITGSVRFAGTAAATVVGGGVALATAPRARQPASWQMSPRVNRRVRSSGNSSVERRLDGRRAEPAGRGLRFGVSAIRRAGRPSRMKCCPRSAHIRE